MKRFIAISLCAFFTCIFIIKGQAVSPEEDFKIFYADKRMHTLVSTDFKPKSALKEKIAREMIESLGNKPISDKILVLAPDCQNKIDVKIKGEIAYINLSSELKETIAKNREIEELFVYQLVNSISTIDGISYVKFTIDGKTEKDFLGFLDMRETFSSKSLI